MPEEAWITLASTQAIIFGAPTYMGSVPWQFKKFADATSRKWFTREWQDKVFGGFTNSASLNGDKQVTLIYLQTLASQHGGIWVSLGVILTLAFLVVALAAYVQASVGFAYALLTAPLLQLVAPDLVPGPVLFSSLALSGLTAWREREWLDRRGLSLALIGRVAGALLAGFALGLFAARTYDLVFGGLIIVATFVSLWGGGVRPTSATLVGAGFASGFMGTLTSVGGPPMALVYQNASGPTLRSTLNAYFAVGSTISLGVLAAAGRFGFATVTIERVQT